MSLPSREQVIEWGMWLYHSTFVLVFVVSVFTVAYVIHNLLPREEY